MSKKMDWNFEYPGKKKEYTDNPLQGLQVLQLRCDNYDNCQGKIVFSPQADNEDMISAVVGLDWHTKRKVNGQPEIKCPDCKTHWNNGHNLPNEEVLKLVRYYNV